jgi:hypothetical protein
MKWSEILLTSSGGGIFTINTVSSPETKNFIMSVLYCKRLVNTYQD